MSRPTHRNGHPGPLALAMSLLAVGCLAQSGSSAPDGDVLASQAAAAKAAPTDSLPHAGGSPNATPGIDNLPVPASQPGSTAASPNAAAPVAIVPAPTPTASNSVVDPRYPYALIGRFDLTDPNKPRFALAGSKIGVRFTGTSLAVQLADSGYDAFDVAIDGTEYAAVTNQFALPSASMAPCLPVAQVPAFDGKNFPGCLLLNSSTNLAVPTTYPIATNLAPGEHTAWLTKRTEFLQGRVGKVQLFGFVVDAGAAILSPPAQFRRRIEVMGDSSCIGYGAAQPSPCDYLERNADGGRSLASYLGQYLRAESVNISSSGQGVYLSYYDQAGDHNLPTIYRQRIPQEPTPYDYSLDHVDAVILSAGGDDLWGSGGSGAFSNNNPAIQTPARTLFVAAYTNWLAEIRSKRPDASIFCTMTPAAFSADIVTLGSAIQDAVAARNAAGDSNVLYFSYFPANNPSVNPQNFANLYDAAAKLNLPFGCRGHPQPAMSQYFAGVLGPVVAKRLGWTDVGF